MKNAWKKVNKLKKKGYKGLNSTIGQKPWENFWKENDKNLTWIWIGLREREKSFLKSLKMWRTHEKAFFKKLSEQFSIGRKLDSINRKSHSIDPASIELRSSQANSNQVFYRNFDRSSNKFDRLKIWKKSNFWKTEHFNAETPQNTMFYEKNAWVWDEIFFKNPWI